MSEKELALVAYPVESFPEGHYDGVYAPRKGPLNVLLECAGFVGFTILCLALAVRTVNCAG